MYLSQLSIHGFKSFAEPTELLFDEGLTAIVGPNGCGKSNIVDAVRWVIGEQRARILRSEKMENVIFNGTAKRRPLGMAEVTLTIENNRGVLPTEYNEVTLGRRLYRSGDSEYLLNDSQCRLKDITELFMDTGMGADAYSVIELKMIDEILSSSTEDRRRLFEEAAGITKYKQRRRQALRKLENTQADLTRVRDLTDEVAKRVRRLKRQAKKAASYNERKERLDTLELQLAQAEFTRLQQQQGELAEQLQATRDEVSAYTARLQREEARLEELRTAAVGQEQTVSARQEELATHREQVRALEADLRLTEERLANAQSEQDRLQQAQAEGDARIATLEQERDALKEQIAAQQPLTTAAQEARAEAKAYRGQMAEEATALREHRDAQRARESTLQRKQAEQQRALDRLENRIDLQAEELERLDAATGAAAASLDALDGRVAETKEALDAAEAAVADAEEALATAEARHAAVTERLETRRSTLHTAERAADAAAHEVALLESLVDAYDDFSDAVQFLAEQDDWAPDGLHTVADALTCPPALRPALDAALGDLASCIIVPAPSHVAEARKRLQSAGRGRATFLVQERLPEPPPPPTVPDEAKPLSAQVKGADRAHQRLGEVLLHACYLAPSVDEAADLAASSSASARFITPDGEWVDGRGLVHGGGASDETAVATRRLERRDQLAAARATLETAEAKRAAAEHAVAETEDTLREVPLQKRRSARDAAERGYQEARRTHEQATYERTQARQAQAAHEQQRAEQEEALAALRNEQAPRQEALRATSEALQKAEAARADAAEALATADQAERAAQDAFNAANVEAVRAENTLDRLTSEHQRTTERITELADQQTRRTARLEALAETLAHTRKEKGDIQTALEDLQQQRGALEDAVSAARTELMEQKVQVNNVEKRLRQLRSSRETHVQTANEHEVRLAEVNTRLNDLNTDVAETYDRSLADAPVPLPDAFNADEARSEVRELRQSLQGMGSINALALEEYEEEQDRLDFLTAQQDDLEQAEDTLLDTITEINTTAEARFLETFETIRAHFQELFQELFGAAAAADLALEDADDPLESPIDIRAKPRGKRPVSLTQLSSGEKALTAVALLFSIYLVKPSPFCILDEVDAPLDDANVQRFMQLIERFADRTQFILVTHNQQTMEHADRLYGITMQEAGVSKLVSVKFEEALEMAG